MKLLLIDGSNLLCQMFFGMPARITGSHGRAIHGTLGFVGTLIRMIRMTAPTHIAVLFDGEHDNPRSALSAEYKANRTGYADTPDAENPFTQLPDIYAALDFMDIPHTEIDVVEGDDVIAAYALTYGGGIEIVIASLDSDFFQLITGNVTVLRYRGDKTVICDSGWIQEKYGIPPTLYADLKSLTGDASDNIRGAEGIGPKTAAALLRQFGSLQAVLEKADDITKPAIRESVRRNTARLQNNYRLIKLDDRAAMPFSLDALRYTYSGVTTNEVLKGIGVRE
ncbi:MAG: flap endonuclease [Oscillospiraceae bacterium]|nr:flap endonuclease [Oscillospiraceae bacterium]